AKDCGRGREKVRTTSQLLLTFLLNASWQVVLITAAAALCDWLLRGVPSRYRHALWVIALVLSVLVPALSVSPRLNRVPAAATQPAPQIDATPVVITTIRSIEGEVIEPAETKTPAAATNPPPRNLFAPVHVNP